MQEIINNYPPVIKQIREIQQIAGAGDAEFAALSRSINEVSANMFVLTAGESGITRFEKIYGIIPAPGQNLSERRLNILARTRSRKMGLSGLYEILQGYAELILNHDIEDELFQITLCSDTASFKIMQGILDDVLPLDVVIDYIFRLAETIFSSDYQSGLKLAACINETIGQSQYMGIHGSNEVMTDYDIVLTVEKSLWYLDGQHLLDGSRNLDAEVIEYTV